MEMRYKLFEPVSDFRRECTVVNKDTGETEPGYFQ